MRHVLLCAILTALTACDKPPPEPMVTSTSGSPMTTGGVETGTTCGTDCTPQQDPCKAAGSPCDPHACVTTCPDGLGCVTVAGHSPDFGYCAVLCDDANPCAHGSCWPDGLCRDEFADFTPPAGCPGPEPLAPRNAYWLPGCEYVEILNWNDDAELKPHNVPQMLSVCVGGQVQHCGAEPYSCRDKVEHCIQQYHYGDAWARAGL